jgi:hypothetical protein
MEGVGRHHVFECQHLCFALYLTAVLCPPYDTFLLAEGGAC